MIKAKWIFTMVLSLCLAAALPAQAAEILEGDANVDQRSYPSTAPFIHPPFYNARVAVEVDENGVILSVTDNGTGVAPSVEEGNEEFWANKNKAYWDVAAAAAFDLYVGKTLEEVKEMDPLGVDATTGATMAGAAIHEAVINAMEGKAGKTFLPGEGSLLPVQEITEDTVIMESLLPADFSLEVLDIRYGVYNAEEEIVPADDYTVTYEDGLLSITFADPSALRPGIYLVNVIDASGTYRSPSFEGGITKEGTAQAGYFVIEAVNETVGFENGAITLAEGSVEDYMKNIEHVLITPVDAAADEETSAPTDAAANAKAAAPADAAAGAKAAAPADADANAKAAAPADANEVKSIEQEPVGHHGTVNSSFVVLDSDGKLNADGVVKNRDGSETILFEEGKNYTVTVSAFGYPDLEFAYPEESDATAEAKAAGTAENATANETENEAGTETVSESVSDDAAQVAPASLGDWSGEWNNILGYLEAEDAESFADLLACEFTSVTIDDSTITFVTDDGKKSNVAYEHAGVLDNGMDLFCSTDKNCTYPYLGMWAPEIAEDEEGMSHFHFRYGESVSELMTNENWYPTMVMADTTSEQVLNGLAAFAAESAEEGEAAGDYATGNAAAGDNADGNAAAGDDAEDSAENAALAEELLEDLSGTYEELFTVICDPAYDELWLSTCTDIVGKAAAPDAADMLKSACTGTLYGEDAIEAYGDGSEGAQFDCSFIGDVSQFVFDGNMISGLDAKGNEVFSNEYEFVDTFSIGGMMDGYLYEASKADSEDFRYFFILPDTPDSTYHIEFRYGSDLDDLAAYNTGDLAYWLAAGIPVDRDEQLVEDVIALFCEENLAE